MSDQEHLREALANGDYRRAAEYAEAALVDDPDNALLRGRLGSIRMALGDFEAGVAALRMAAEASPRTALLWNELGVALATVGDIREAERVMRRALMHGSEIPEIHNNYGNVFRKLGEHAKAAACYQAALKRRPDYAEARANLGLVMLESGELETALESFEAVLAANPDDAAAWSHKAATLTAMGRYLDAEAGHRNAIVADPGRAESHNNYAILLNALGRTDEARASYTRAIAYAPDDAGIHSNFLMGLCYDRTIDAAGMVAAHRAWAQRHAPVGETAAFDLPADGPLRVGYVSPDFHEHSVAYFLESVFQHHDPARIALHAYSDAVTADAMTARLRGAATMWRDTRELSDSALLETIRDDGIQVLVDLAGHTGHNRLGVFARRAAPIQVTWLGYGATTGLPQMDYRLSDRWTDPEGVAEPWWCEKLLRLPGGFLCYAPPDCPLPMGRDGPVTFGSFNNLSKMNPAVIELWARVMNAVPGSRLLLKAKQLADLAVGEQLRDAFAGFGIEPARIEFAGRTASRDDHLALYGRVDVALDTFPYNGATTSCEALWMGTPVVTLAGERSTARYGASLLANASFGEWIAETSDEFVAIASRLTQSRPSRGELRARLEASPLTDGRRMAGELEDVYEALWRNWVRPD